MHRHEALDSHRYDWWPDPAAYHSAETLHHDATEALRKLVQAAPMTVEALATGPSRAAQADTDDGPWETVPVVLDPLRSAQDRERLTIIVPSESHARSISR